MTLKLVIQHLGLFVRMMNLGKYSNTRFYSHYLGRVKRICVFEHSVTTNFTAHARPFRGARDQAFCLKVPLDSLLVWASSGGSGETAQMRRLAWTFAARIGDKYQIHLTRPIWLLFKITEIYTCKDLLLESCWAHQSQISYGAFMIGAVTIFMILRLSIQH